ncbi:monocarboxylate transporter 12-like [Liolophura sinensis]|uniref:monocarboxylate transporter 12-like n=1 Tax=Liolophura sinensis TaxID=3198878 RepID=UPI0031582A2E
MGKTGPPIDRGWAWMIALGLFLKSLINGGFIKSYGIFFSAFSDTYGRSASETQLIRSARAVCATLSGPFGTALSERYTERVVVIVGALISSAGFILAFFADSLEFVIFTFGVCGGIGISLINGPSRVCLGRYFDKKRGRANSLSLMGASVGQVAVPPLISLLMATYALRGSMLIYGGIFLNIVITGALLRPLKSYSSTEKETVAVEECSPHDASGDTLEDAETGDNTGSKTAKDAGASRIPNGKHQNLDEGTCCSNGTLRDIQGSPRVDRPTLLSLTSTTSEENFKGSTRSITERMRHVGSHLSLSTIEDPRSVPEVEIVSPSETLVKRKCSVCSPLVSFIKFIFDPQVLGNPLYILFLFSSSLFMVANTNQVTFIVPRAEEIGISREMAAVLLSVVGGCDFFGRFLFGVLADIKCLSSHHVMAFGTTISSAVMFALPFTRTFPEMVAVAAIFGLVGSSHAILQLPVMVDFVGKEGLAKAVGMGIFFRGIFSSVLAPLLGKCVGSLC